MAAMTFPNAELFSAGSGEPSLRWGLVGPGWIAGEFVDAVHAHTRQRFTVVSSHSIHRARAFARNHGVATAVGSAEELLARDDVDVVYIASPPGAHLEEGLAAIVAGKHVLIEKPIACTEAEVRTLIECARSARVLVMEAMWSRYLPQASVIRRLLADGALGELRALHADHGQAIDPGPHHRLSDPALGGGALLDLGIYPVQFDSMVLGAPRSITAVGGMTSTGVDAYATVVLDHGGAQSTLTASMVARTGNGAVISGSTARLELAPFFYNPTDLALVGNEHGAEPAVWTDPTGLRGFAALSWEATALARFVGQGLLESPLHDHAETARILSTIDEARRQLAAEQG